MTNGSITSRGAVVLRSLTILVAMSLFVMLVACGGSNNNNNNNNTPPTVSLSSFPGSLYPNDTAPITATVTNDPSNAGVTWSCTPSGSCGSFSANSSSSGTPVTYTAPGSAGSITITATSKADSSVSKSASVTINQASGITVSLSGVPASIVTGGTASITATVNNDSANGGVTWSCAPAGTCGSFSANTSPSGQAVTYTAPASPGSVTITATSVTDDAQIATNTIMVTSTVTTTLAAGNYAFYVAGWDLIGNQNSSAANGPYTYAGAFTVDSNGNITGGEQDYVDDYYFSGAAESITGGSVAATADGNLLITIQSGDTIIGNGTGTIVLDASPVSTSKALLTEYDAWASGSGELDLQSTTLATPTGGYALYMNGYDINGLPISLGGVVNVDGTNTISGAGTVADINDDGNLFPAQTFVNTSTVTSPDSFGYVRFELNADCSQPTTDPQLCVSTPSLVTDGYMVDNNHIRLVENWYTDSLSAGIGGTALAQGANTGTFGASTISGSTYVVGTKGYDTNGALQVAGVLTFNSDLSVSGNLSFNDTVETAPPQGGAAITGGTYVVDSTGRVTVSNATDGATFTYNLQLYLTGGGQAVVISMDNSDVVSGFGWQQTSSTLNASAFTGAYALDMTESVGGNEQDAVGGFTSDGVSSLSGFFDVNETVSVSPGTLAADQTFSSTYATTSTNGVFAVTGNGSTPQMFTSYLIDGTNGVVIENDNSQLSLGYFEQQ